jgi:uncharacterized BrkB/YihY/UPF0761 family membrane protein
MKRSFLRGRTGRIVLMIAALLLITVAMFALASVFMAYDPDGHLTRRWLHDSRWALFTWRLLMYAGIAVVWRMKVRPQMLARWPEVGSPAAHGTARRTVYCGHGVRGLGRCGVRRRGQ